MPDEVEIAPAEDSPAQPRQYNQPHGAVACHESGPRHRNVRYGSYFKTIRYRRLGKAKQDAAGNADQQSGSKLSPGPEGALQPHRQLLSEPACGLQESFDILGATI
jgi:hypothetical protein